MRKKKLVSFALAVTMMFGSAAALPNSVFTYQNRVSAGEIIESKRCGDWEYELHYDDEAVIIGYYGTASSINVPTEVDGKKVTRFAWVDWNNYSNTVISVNLPSTIENIDIENCDGSNLKNFNVDSKNNKYSSVDGILYNKDKTVLLFCPQGKTTVNIPNTVTSIYYSSFECCSKLTSISIPKSVSSIKDHAFYGCSNLSSIDLQNSEVFIDSNVFDGTKWFSEQSKNNSIVMLNNVLIDGHTCSGKVSIPKNTVSIASYAFRSYYANEEPQITEVSFPSSLRIIGDYSFLRCTNLSSINIPEGVVTIGEGAFKNCTGVKSVVIPKSVKTIGKKAFGFDSDNKINGFTVYFYKDTEGEKYAKNNEFEYEYYDNGKLKADYSIGYSGSSLGVIMIGSGKRQDTYISIKRSKDNSKAIKNFKGLYVDNIILDKSLYTLYSDTCTIKLSADVFSELSAGDHKLKAVFTDGSDETRINVQSYTGIKNTRYSGHGRFESAAAISTGVFKTADTVVLANGRKFADALAGVPLAVAYNAPILLTEQNGLPSETLAEIKRLGAKNVLILGGSGVVGNEVKESLTKNSIKYEVVKGSSRFDTAIKIAEKTQQKNEKAPTEIFFVNYDSYADALSVSTVAALKGASLFYVKNDGDVDADTKAQLEKIKSTVTKAYVIGGSGAISEKMRSNISKALGGKNVDRIKGSNRYDTCVKINELFSKEFDGNTLCVATGTNFPDALAGGVFAAVNKSPLFLTNKTLETTQKAFLRYKDYTNVYVFGGNGAVPQSAVSSINAVLSISDRINTANIHGMDSSNESKNTIVIYCWNTEFKVLFDKYYPKYTKRKVETSSYKDYNGNDVYEVVSVDGKKIEWWQITNQDNAYQKRLDEGLNKQFINDKKIDLFLAEAGYIQKYVSSNNTNPVALSVKDIGITENDTKNMYQYTKDLASDQSTNEVRGLSWQTTAGLFYYDSQKAKEVLGSDDPTVVQNAVKDWDSFKATAEKMKKKGYKMLSSYEDTLRVFGSNLTEPFVKNNKIIVDTSIKNWINQAKEYTDSGYTNKATWWDYSWKSDSKVFGFFMPSWGVNGIIKPYDWDGSASKWRACQGPAAWYWGGSWLCGAVDSDNQDIVADILRTMTCNKDLLVDMINDNEEMVNNKAAIDSVKNSYKCKYLGDQNHLALMSENAQKINVKGKCSAYDEKCIDAWQDVMYYYMKKQIAFEDIEKSYKEKLKSKNPQLS